MAPFDEYLYTKGTRKGQLVYSLTASFISGIGIYGVEADNASVVVTDIDGNVLVSEQFDLWEQAYGEFEYLFGNLQMRMQSSFDNIPLNPNLNVTVTLTRNDPNVNAAVGWIGVGQWREFLAPQSECGATQYGVEVSPKSYALMVKNQDGTYKREQGRTSKVINATLLIDASAAPAAESLLRQILDTPVAVEASSLAQYGHISTFGFVTGTVVSETFNTARVSLKIEGNV